MQLVFKCGFVRQTLEFHDTDNLKGRIFNALVQKVIGKTVSNCLTNGIDSSFPLSKLILFSFRFSFINRCLDWWGGHDLHSLFSFIITTARTQWISIYQGRSLKRSRGPVHNCWLFRPPVYTLTLLSGQIDTFTELVIYTHSSIPSSEYSELTQFLSSVWYLGKIMRYKHCLLQSGS